jgi:hypothetical protein
MADYNKELSELHRRVVQAELQLLATIDERGCVQVKHPDLGEVEIFLSGARPSTWTSTAPFLRIMIGRTKISCESAISLMV